MATGNYLAAGERVGIRRVTVGDHAEWARVLGASAAFHRPWGDWGKTREEFEAYVATRGEGRDEGFLVCELAGDGMAGVVNVNNVVRGAFQSAYLGYAVGEAFARRGFMAEGLRLVVGHAFSELGLHRVEANIQPGNLASIALVRKLGFRLEGYSPKYLKVMGEWRDHERWAVVAEEWKGNGVSRRQD